MGEHLAIRATAPPHIYTPLDPQAHGSKGEEWFGAKDASKYPTMHQTALQNKALAAARLGCIGDVLGAVSGLSVAFAFLQVQMGSLASKARG